MGLDAGQWALLDQMPIAAAADALGHAICSANVAGALTRTVDLPHHRPHHIFEVLVPDGDVRPHARVLHVSALNGVHLTFQLAAVIEDRVGLHSHTIAEALI